MPGVLTIEATEASSFGIPVGVPHLCLIYREAGTGREYVIRSGPDQGWSLFGREMKVETNVPIEQSADARDGETPADRSSTPLDFPGLTDDRAWSIMVKYAEAIAAAEVSYDLLDRNSNTFVAALLAACGVAPDTALPRGIDADEAIGFADWRGLAAKVPPPADWIFRGTAGADALVGRQFDEEFRLFAGNDSLRAGRGNDTAAGGFGHDRLFGDAGNDRLAGEAGNDVLQGGPGNDTLWGGQGADLLAGGAGNDRCVGGTGADVFLFANGTGADRVDDFQPGLDRLRIQSPAVTAFDDLAIRAEGADLRISFANATVLLVGTGLGELTPEDVQIVAPDLLIA